MNIRFIASCFNCGKVEDVSNLDIEGGPYNCSCGGFIITPTGKMQGQIIDGGSGKDEQSKHYH
jgi:hypothetical protein